MRDARLRFGIAFVAVALALGLVTLIFWDFVRETIITPIYYSLWVGGLLINSVPQAIFLGLLVLLCGGIGLNALSNSVSGRARPSHQSPPTLIESRYLHWERLCANLYMGQFSRHLFVSDARRLILSVLAFEYRLEPRQIETMVRDGEIAMPETIRNLVLGRDEFMTQPALGWVEGLLARLQRTPKEDPQVDTLLKEIITFIEGHLEIMHVANQPEATRN
jgi:hypothetical protein